MVPERADSLIVDVRIYGHSKINSSLILGTVNVTIHTSNIYCEADDWKHTRPLS